MAIIPSDAFCGACHLPYRKHGEGKCLYEPSDFKEIRCTICTVIFCMSDFNNNDIDVWLDVDIQNPSQTFMQITATQRLAHKSCIELKNSK